MTELDKIERAKMYLEKLASGVDPRNDRELPADTVLNDVRLARCFFYAVDVLRRVIENGGEVSTPKKVKRQNFALTPEQMSSVQISRVPISISDLVDKLNSLVDTTTMKKVTTKAITNWLLENGFLQKVTNDAGKTNRLPTGEGKAIGLLSELRRTIHGEFPIVLYSAEAQTFILDNLSAILEPVE